MVVKVPTAKKAVQPLILSCGMRVFCYTEYKYISMRHDYTPIVQLPYCCVPATLQWILYRRGLPIGDQIFIGEELGLRIPKKFASFFEKTNVEILDPSTSTQPGTQIFTQGYTINEFFEKENYALKLSDQYQPKDVDNSCTYISRNIEKGSDVIVRYNSAIHNGRSLGHFGVVTEINIQNKKVIIGDPEPPFFKELSISQLLEAMSEKYDGIKRGLFVVSRTQ